MTALDETRLRRLLQEHITEPYEVTEILELEDEVGAEGQPTPHRESELRRWEGRLARLRLAAPDRADTHRDHEAIIGALRALSSSERLFHWAARSAAREYHGMCSMRSVVSCLSYARIPAGTPADPGASPNGGPATRPGNSGAGGGPPSVSSPLR